MTCGFISTVVVGETGGAAKEETEGRAGGWGCECLHGRALGWVGLSKAAVASAASARAFWDWPLEPVEP